MIHFFQGYIMLVSHDFKLFIKGRFLHALYTFFQSINPERKKYKAKLFQKNRKKRKKEIYLNLTKIYLTAYNIRQIVKNM